MLVHVINLDRSLTRLAEFHHWTGHLRSIQRVVAVDGKTYDVSRSIDIGLVDNDILNSYSEGGIGAAMSHIALWEIAIDNSEAITVCEDDAIFNRFFDLEAPRLLDSLPSGWDLIMRPRSRVCVSARGLNHDRRGGPIIPTHWNQ